MINYSYSKGIIPDLLQKEIVESGLNNIVYIETVGEDVFIFFSEELSTEQKSLLDSLVSTHTGSEAIEFRTKIEGRIIRGQNIIWEFREWVINNVISPNNLQILTAMSGVKSLIDSGLLSEASYALAIVSLSILDQAYDESQTCRVYFSSKLIGAL